MSRSAADFGLDSGLTPGLDLSVPTSLNAPVERGDLPERGKIRFESDSLHAGVQHRSRQRVGHFRIAHHDRDPAGLDGCLLGVAEIGHQDEIICRDQPDGIVAREIRQVGQIGRMGEEQPIQLELLHRVANGFVSDLQICFSTTDNGLHAFPVR